VADSKSASQDILYVMYRRAYPNRTAPNAAPQQAVVAISRNGAKTFEEPVSAIGNVYQDAALRAGKFIPMLSVAPNGRLDAAWWDTRPGGKAKAGAR